jgi:hypothetical protein
MANIHAGSRSFLEQELSKPFSGKRSRSPRSLGIEAAIRASYAVVEDVCD